MYYVTVICKYPYMKMLNFIIRKIITVYGTHSVMGENSKTKEVG